jgi:hypothetical protein
VWHVDATRPGAGSPNPTYPRLRRDGTTIARDLISINVEYYYIGIKRRDVVLAENTRPRRF